MKTIGLRNRAGFRNKFDRMSRYRLSALLFGIMYCFLITRLIGWPDLPTSLLRTIFLTLSTPAMMLLLYNLGESSWSIYQGKRRIDKLLDERASATADDQVS